MNTPRIEIYQQYYGSDHDLQFHKQMEDAARDIGARLCEADAMEATLATGRPAEKVPLACVRETARAGGMVAVCCINGRPELIYGYKRKGLLSDQAEVWMLRTQEPDRWPALFARESAAMLADMMFFAGPVRHFENVVYRGNGAAIRWLKWLGFRLDRKVARDWIHFYGNVGTLRLKTRHLPGVRIYRSHGKEAAHGRGD